MKCNEPLEHGEPCDGILDPHGDCHNCGFSLSEAQKEEVSFKELDNRFSDFQRAVNALNPLSPDELANAINAFFRAPVLVKVECLSEFGNLDGATWAPAKAP